MSGFGMGGMWFWWLLPLLLVGGIVYWAAATGNTNRKSRRALDILDERLAKGEIDEATYEKLRATLTEER